MGLRENRYGPVAMTAVTGFLVRIGVRAFRNSRTESTNSTTARRVSNEPSGSTAYGNSCTGHTRLIPTPTSIETRYTIGGRATTTTPPSCASGPLLTAEPPPATELALPRTDRVLLRRRRGRTRSLSSPGRGSACGSRRPPCPPPARDPAPRGTPGGAQDRCRRSMVRRRDATSRRAPAFLRRQPSRRGVYDGRTVRGAGVRLQ